MGKMERLFLFHESVTKGKTARKTASIDNHSGRSFAGPREASGVHEPFLGCKGCAAARERGESGRGFIFDLHTGESVVRFF
jgi:hypothetical protein